VEIVNFVKYKVFMSNNYKNPQEKQQTTQNEDTQQYNQSGVYLRDDHCDWGSSGMNDFTNEYSESK
tara:strand:- start:405 stop:602 length:198 start_codon:yes stop_codon:yes gene_type:complete